MKVKCFQNTWSILRRAIYGNDSSFILIKRYNHRVNPQDNSRNMLKTSFKETLLCKIQMEREKDKTETKRDNQMRKANLIF